MANKRDNTDAGPNNTDNTDNNDINTDTDTGNNNMVISVLSSFLKIQFGGKHKWTSLFHNGIIFPPPYEPHNIPITYDGTMVALPPLAEEYAMLYAKYLKTDYVLNKTFNKNFWNDWKKTLGSATPIESLDKCDFTEYVAKLADMKMCKSSSGSSSSNSSNDTTNATGNESDENKYKVAIVDGKEQEVANYRIEPPGIFIGRGDNPNIGKIKRRIYPEDVIINIAKNVEIPKTPENHKWKQVIHNRRVEWIAAWNDTITGKMKYVWLGASSDFKANSDLKKFELARKLKKKIKKINAINEENLISNNPKTRQLATALYFIDKLAIRIGNEKSTDEADTVGITTLRVEHITLIDDKLEFDFLGKDSVRYHNSITIEKIIKDNIKSFSDKKEKYEELFDLISSSDVNTYLQTFMKDLTAKVYRSYNASNIFQKELLKINKKYCKDATATTDILLGEYNKANIKVAKLLNHQKNINRSHKEQVDKISDMIKKQKGVLKKMKTKRSASNTSRMEKIRTRIKDLKGKKDLKEEMKNISLGTSKENYIDPRITIAFMKKHAIPIEKLFTVKLQKKFKWAFEIDSDWVF